MIGHKEVVRRCVAWASQVTGVASTYSQQQGQKTQALPDVAGWLRTSVMVPEDPINFPGLRIQQAWLRVYNVTVSFMYDNSDDQAADNALLGYADLLGVGLHDDASLSGRVPMASPRVTFDFSRPFVEYEDGTVGREMTMQFAVAELVEE